MTFHAKTPVAVATPCPAFDQEVLALRPALWAFARRLLRQEADAEDLVQDTIVRALAARDRFQDGTNLKAWLFTIMRNSFNSRWRRGLREVMPGAEAIDRMLRDLTPAHRDILILIPVLGVSYEDAAQACGCSVGTVKSRLNRARGALAALVGSP